MDLSLWKPSVFRTSQLLPFLTTTFRPPSLLQLIYIAYFSAALNSFIHVIMYGYYFLSALGFKQVAFIKFYITRSQMTQFCLMMVQASWDMYSMKVLGRPGYPFFITALLWFYMWTMLGLFYNFYRKNAKLAKDAKKAKLAEAAKEKNKKLQ